MSVSARRYPSVGVPSDGASMRGPGFWGWFLQRVTGVLLVAFLIFHIWINHFAGIPDLLAGRVDELVEFHIVKARLLKSLYFVVDLALLGLVLHHGLNGLRNILLEWSVAARRQRPITMALWVIGIGTFAYGTRALMAFLW